MTAAHRCGERFRAKKHVMGMDYCSSPGSIPPGPVAVGERRFWHQPQARPTSRAKLHKNSSRMRGASRQR